MPLPYSFISGEVAKSSQVNANFNYVMDIIGQLSTPGSIASLGEFKLGPRALALFSAAQDTGPDASAFFQLAWNVNWNKVGSTWRYDRRIANNPATAVKVGKDGFSILSTSQVSGDLNNQITVLLRLVATTGDEILYIKDDVHIQNYNNTARNIQDYRLTQVFLETPIPIYANKYVGKGTTVFNAYNLGVPSTAQGIVVYAHVTADNYSGAGMHIYQRRPTSSALDYFRGFVTHAPITGSGLGMRAGSQGTVPLGRGSQKGDFVVHRTANFALANVYIMGYLT
jgi:hypothetical protein